MRRRVAELARVPISPSRGGSRAWHAADRKFCNFRYEYRLGVAELARVPISPSRKLDRVGKRPVGSLATRLRVNHSRHPMEQRTLGKTDLTVSRLALGTMTFGSQ